MKKMLSAFFVVLLAMFFVACEGGDYNEGDSDDGDDNPITLCGDSICENGETHENCRADCPADPEPECGNSVCENGENSQNCVADCPIVGPVCGNGTCEVGENETNCADDCATPCEDEDDNGICDNAEYLATYCYDQRQLDAVYGNTVDYYGQFSYPDISTVVGWLTQDDHSVFSQSGNTICYQTRQPVPMGTNLIYADVTAGIREENFWIAQSVSPKSVSITLGDTVTARPILPYVQNRGYLACLDEEAAVCWENLCTRNKAGILTCYNSTAVDNACGVTKSCLTCVDHCDDVYDIISP